METPNYLVIKTSYHNKVLKDKESEELNPEYMDWLNLMLSEITELVYYFGEQTEQHFIKIIEGFKFKLLNDSKYNAKPFTFNGKVGYTFENVSTLDFEDVLNKIKGNKLT